MVKATRTRSRGRMVPAAEDIQTVAVDVGDMVAELIEFLENSLICVDGNVPDPVSRKMVREDISQRIFDDLNRCSADGVLHNWRSTFESWNRLELRARSRDSSAPECTRATRTANRYLKVLYKETDERIRSAG